MKWLLWKEYRLQRLILAVGLFLLIVPYAASLMVVPVLLLWPDAAADRAIGFAAFVSTILSVATLALLGGHAIASERADRSAEFQAYQPISRRAILASKLFFPVLAAIVLWGVNLCVFDRWSTGHSDLMPDPQWMFLFCIFGFSTFSVAWLLSSLQNSTTFAVGAGIAAPMGTSLLILLVAWLTTWLTSGRYPISEQVFNNTWAAVNFTLGLLSCVVGSWYYVRRVEP